MSLTTSKLKVEAPQLHSLLNVSFGRLKPTPATLPTISQSFFYKGSTSHLHTLQPTQPSYIFFDPALKLPSHLIVVQDFVSPPPTPVPRDDIEAHSELPIERGDFFDMARDNLDHLDKNFETIKAIKDRATLNDTDFKRFLKVIEEFVVQNEDECKKTPRLWKKQNWKDIAAKFVDADGNGQKFWNDQRGGYTSSDDFIYPDDKIDITFLVCMALKKESAKHFSNAKRKDPPVAPAIHGSADAPDARAAKKTKATPKPAEKVTKEPKAPKSTVPSKTPKRAYAKKGKKANSAPLSPENVVEDEESSDEEEITGEVVAGKNIHKNDPFGAARHSTNNPAFARENIVGKPGIPPKQTADGDVGPVDTEPVTAAHMSNDFFAIEGLSPAPRADNMNTDEMDIQFPLHATNDRSTGGATNVDAVGVPHSNIHPSIELSENENHMDVMQDHRVDGGSDSEMLDATHHKETESNFNDVSGTSSNPTPGTNPIQFSLNSPTWDRSSPVESPTSPTSTAQKRRADLEMENPDWIGEPLRINGTPMNYEAFNLPRALTPPDGGPSTDSMIVHTGIRSTHSTSSSFVSNTLLTNLTFGVTLAGIDHPVQLINAPANIPFTNFFNQVTLQLANSNHTANALRAAKFVRMSWYSGQPLTITHKHEFDINAPMVETLWKVAIRSMIKALKAEADDIDGEMIDLVFS